MSDNKRGTGRTTSIALDAISRALISPEGATARDHAGGSIQVLIHTTFRCAEKLGLEKELEIREMRNGFEVPHMEVRRKQHPAILELPKWVEGSPEWSGFLTGARLLVQLEGLSPGGEAMKNLWFEVETPTAPLEARGLDKVHVVYRADVASQGEERAKEYYSQLRSTRDLPWSYVAYWRPQEPESPTAERAPFKGNAERVKALLAAGKTPTPHDMLSPGRLYIQALDTVALTVSKGVGQCVIHSEWEDANEFRDHAEAILQNLGLGSWLKFEALSGNSIVGWFTQIDWR